MDKLSIKEIAILVVLVLLGQMFGRILAEAIYDDKPSVVVVRVTTKDANGST